MVVLILIFFFVSANKSDKNSMADDTLRIGYIVYSPSLVKDPVSGEFSGFSYEIVEAIAKKIGLKTEWV